VAVRLNTISRTEDSQLKQFSLLLVVLFSIRPLSGQVSGVVETSDAQPIAAVSVQIWGQAKLLAEVATDNAGQFRFDIVRSEVSRLRFAHLGLQTVIVPLSRSSCAW
jgi:hypothetical protein